MIHLKARLQLNSMENVATSLGGWMSLKPASLSWVVAGSGEKEREQGRRLQVILYIAIFFTNYRLQRDSFPPKPAKYEDFFHMLYRPRAPSVVASRRQPK